MSEATQQRPETKEREREAIEKKVISKAKTQIDEVTNKKENNEVKELAVAPTTTKKNERIPTNNPPSGNNSTPILLKEKEKNKLESLLFETSKSLYRAAKELNESSNNDNQLYKDGFMLSCMRNGGFENTSRKTRVDLRQSADDQEIPELIDYLNSSCYTDSTVGEKEVVLKGEFSKYLDEIASHLNESNDKKLRDSKLPEESSTPSSKSYTWSAISYVASGISNGVTSVLARYDLVEDYTDYGDDYNPVEYIDEEAKNNILIRENDVLINIPLLLKCCQLIKNYIQNVSKEEKILLFRDKHSHSSSFHAFIRRAGSYYHEQEDKSEFQQAVGYFMHQLNTSNTDLLLRVLEKANYIQVSPEEEDQDKIIALLSTPNNNSDSFLKDSERAMFQLTQTQATLEQQMQQYTNHAAKLAKQAMEAKKQKQMKLALSYMKQRSLQLKERDRCTDLLLNIQQGLNALESTVSNEQVFNAYQVCSSALKKAKEGVNLEDVDEVVLDLNEEFENVSSVNELIGTVGKLNKDDEDEVLMEFQEMEDEMLRNEIHMKFPTVPDSKLVRT